MAAIKVPSIPPDRHLVTSRSSLTLCEEISSCALFFKLWRNLATLKLELREIYGQFVWITLCPSNLIFYLISSSCASVCDDRLLFFLHFAFVSLRYSEIYFEGQDNRNGLLDFCVQDEEEEEARSHRGRRGIDSATRRIGSCYLLRWNPGPLAVGTQ